MSNQFDLNKFNSFLDSASKSISCDSKCQKEKRKNALKDKYIKAESNLTLAEPQYEIAKQNYYTYVSGKEGYNEMREKEFNDKADQFIQQFTEIYETSKQNVTNEIDTYDSLLINYKNVVELRNQYATENSKLFKELKEESNDVLTNERKTYYEDQQNESLNAYYYYFFMTIYGIIVICYISFSLLYPSSFAWKMRFFIGIVLVVSPFMSTWLLGKIIQLIYWLFTLLPKNVYK
jgi:hypothetical protein